MKKTGLLFLLLAGALLPLYAAHIRGGELSYRYIGPGTLPNTSRYVLTVTLYVDCGQNDPGQLDQWVALTVFSKPDNRQYGSIITAPIVDSTTIRYDPNSNPCLTNPPTDVCYRLRYYRAQVELPNRPEGYTIAFQRCCRIQGIQNMEPPSNDYGATYTCDIPGTSLLPGAERNSSPVVTGNDAVAVCMGTAFNFDFSAVDEADGDSLVYQLCNAFVGGGPGFGQNCLTCPAPIPAAAPPYQTIKYQSPYSGTTPLGSSVTLNSATGILSGIAPTRVGQYVVTVCIREYRQGVLINTHRKDIHIKVSDCIPLRARLQPDYSFCDDFLVSFRNLQVNPTGAVYTWDFGDNSAPATSTVPDGTIQHQYNDTGTYVVKLTVSLAGQCVDSTTTLARVYPGFFPGFEVDGACLYTPFRFRDTTRSRYGSAAYWRWTFGDETTQADTSLLPNPEWLYNSLGFKSVQLIVASDKGCRDTVYREVEVTERPALFLPFRDTLICSIDSLQLHASGNGVFEWTPDYRIDGLNLPNPIVYPDRTTTYTVTMTENRCVATDQILVRVVDSVTILPMADTVICTTDTIQLRPATDGLRFEWTADPAAFFEDSGVKYPITVPMGDTRYHLRAHIGKCSSEADLFVRTIDYPQVYAGDDQAICYGDTTRLSGATNGSSFRWEPVAGLTAPETLTPLAHPDRTRTYTLLGFDTLGCPKPGADQVTVTVRPAIPAFAGNDTAIVLGQPLQLQGSGAEFFSWSPESYLNSTSIANPIASPDRDITYRMRAYTADGCFAEDDIHVRVFRTQPDFFVPNAFVPLGKNRVLMPKAVGIRSLDYFRVFNRWGQLVFQTSTLGRGWDGYLNGVLQPTSTYVWMASGTDFTGRKVVRKGTATLIR